MKLVSSKGCTNKYNNEISQNIYELDVSMCKEAFIFALNYFANYKEEIDALNVFPVPDGDTGTNMYLTFSTAIDEIKDLETDSIAILLEEIANGALMGARGNSGVILSQLLRGVAEVANDQKKIGTKEIAVGLKNAAKKAYQGVMKPIEGTILTVAREVGETAVTLAKEEEDIIEFLRLVSEQASTTVKKTPELLEVLEEAGVVDAGGKGYAVILRGLYKYFVCDGEVVVDESELDLVSIEDKHNEGERDELLYKYCTEFLINNTNISDKEIKGVLKDYGDSLLVVANDRVTKVHVHTNNPGLVLEAGLKFGELNKIKIDNMEVGTSSKSHGKSDELTIKEELKDRIGVIAVASGQGIIEILESLGVDLIIEGGQSMNPSTQDLLSAIKKVNANKIIILPNNKNVISAAKQVIELSDREVIVLPTTSIPQGIVAMMGFNPRGEIVDVKEMMEEEIRQVKTGQVTYAVRDAIVNGIEIKQNNILGLAEGDIKVVTDDKKEAILELLEEMVTDNDLLITIYYGEEVDKEEVEGLKECVEAKFVDVDIEIHAGDQPIYYYLISIE